MMAADPLHAVISAHRAAWEAFQVAPDGRDAEFAEDAMHEALKALVVAASAFPILAKPLPVGVPALLSHLRWWLGEEAEFADDYQPDYRILQARAADLAAALEIDAHDVDALAGIHSPIVLPTTPDAPILALIDAADAAAAVHTSMLADFDESDEGQMRRHNAAAAAVAEAHAAVLQAMPATATELHALAAYHVRDGKLYDRDREAVEHLAAALARVLP